MKTVGIIGGIGPESTIEYYRSIISLYRERKGHGYTPAIIINSIDNRRMLELIGTGQLTSLTEYILVEIEKLFRAGANFGVLAANTPHIIFDDLQKRSPISLVSIVETTCRAAELQGLKRVGLLGTLFTMAGRFYPDVFDQTEIALVTPTSEEQEYIHEKYIGELLHNIFLAETRQGLLSIVERLRREEDVDGLILGGTELPLILRDASYVGIPFLDTTKLHVERIVEELLSERGERRE
jgi:aspartate racemase